MVFNRNKTTFSYETWKFIAAPSTLRGSCEENLEKLCSGWAPAYDFPSAYIYETRPYTEQNDANRMLGKIRVQALGGSKLATSAKIYDFSHFFQFFDNNFESIRRRIMKFLPKFRSHQGASVAYFGKSLRLFPAELFPKNRLEFRNFNIYHNTCQWT